jgi:DNA polymerase-1
MNLKDANNLFLEGQIALAEIESNGIRIDIKYLDSAIAKVSRKIDKYQDVMQKSAVWATWKEIYGIKANMGSRPQLGRVLFDNMRVPYPGKEKTKSGRYSTDEVILSQIPSRFVKRFIKLEGLKKLKSTYLVRLRNETIDGYYHPDHHLNTVTTYRSSADGIQTIPTRDEKARAIIRRSFIPRPGHALVSIDYSAHEFKMCSLWWKDPDMMRYASDSTLDIHRDQAMEMFCCSKEQVTKDLRYLGKNGFVFPRLYGSYYLKIAQAVWPELIGKTINDGKKEIPVIEWLANKGIKECGACNKEVFPPEEGTYEHHVLEVQKRFDKKFPVWANSRDEWHKLYRKRGWFRQPIGFIQRGLYSNNDLDNHPIQGWAFHCLLWSAITIVKELKKSKMGTKVLAEIHDDLLADSPLEEISDYLNLAERVMTEDIRKEWPRITIPLAIEAKMSTESWNDMKTVEKKGKIWQLKT